MRERNEGGGGAAWDPRIFPFPVAVERREHCREDDIGVATICIKGGGGRGETTKWETKQIPFRFLQPVLTRRYLFFCYPQLLTVSGIVGHGVNSLKGQCHEIFCFWFFSSISFPPAPEYPIRNVSKFFESSRIYSQLKVDHRCRWHRWQMRKIFSQKNFNNFVGTPLDSRVNTCSTTGKPTHLFRTKCVSLDSV